MLRAGLFPALSGPDCLAEEQVRQMPRIRREGRGMAVGASRKEELHPSEARRGALELRLPMPYDPPKGGASHGTDDRRHHAGDTDGLGAARRRGSPHREDGGDAHTRRHGGRAKTFYRVAPFGLEALRHMREMRERLAVVE